MASNIINLNDNKCFMLQSFTIPSLDTWKINLGSHLYEVVLCALSMHL